MAFYGDVAVVHALVDVKRGEEVTIIGDGVHPFDSYRERKCDIKAIMRRSGFSCTCRLCEFDRNDLLERKRRELVLSIDDHVRRAETRAVCVSAAVEAITRILHEVGIGAKGGSVALRHPISGDCPISLIRVPHVIMKMQCGNAWEMKTSIFTKNRISCNSKPPDYRTLPLNYSTKL